MKKDIGKLEPHITARCAINSPSTGIFDTHRFMKGLEVSARGRGALFAYGCVVYGIEKTREGFLARIRDADGGKISLSTKVLINSAGLYSDEISRMAGLDKIDYNLTYCKGQYFRISSQKSCKIKHLIYPAPNSEEGTLGIHATPDLDGSVRLGPDTQYIKREEDYSVDEARRSYFYESVRGFLSFIEPGDLTADTAGIRPKLHGPGGGFKDFIIRHEGDSNLHNFINLIGIESPGLTCSLAVARYVKEIVKNI